MSLNRRIVLEDSEINSDPKPIPEAVQDYWAQDHWARRRAEPSVASVMRSGPLAEAALTRAIRDGDSQAYEDFLTLNRIGQQADLSCKGCFSRRGFETDFSTRSLTCRDCGRNTPFDLFAMEHPG